MYPTSPSCEDVFKTILSSWHKKSWHWWAFSLATSGWSYRRPAGTGRTIVLERRTRSWGDWGCVSTRISVKKWGPYKWPYKCGTGVITTISGVITLLKTGRGPLTLNWQDILGWSFAACCSGIVLSAVGTPFENILAWHVAHRQPSQPKGSWDCSGYQFCIAWPMTGRIASRVSVPVDTLNISLSTTKYSWSMLK